MPVGSAQGAQRMRGKTDESTREDLAIALLIVKAVGLAAGRRETPDNSLPSPETTQAPSGTESASSSTAILWVIAIVGGIILVAVIAWLIGRASSTDATTQATMPPPVPPLPPADDADRQ